MKTFRKILLIVCMLFITSFIMSCTAEDVREQAIEEQKDQFPEENFEIIVENDDKKIILETEDSGTFEIETDGTNDWCSETNFSHSEEIFDLEISGPITNLEDYEGIELCKSLQNNKDGSSLVTYFDEDDTLTISETYDQGGHLISKIVVDGDELKMFDSNNDLIELPDFN